MKSPTIDFRMDQWPVVFIKIDGEQTLADFDEYIATFNEMYKRQERFSIVTFLKRYSVKTEIVGRIGRWFKETEPLIKKYWISNAMVSQSAGFRFLVSTVYLIKPLPISSRVCATPEEAVIFTKACWPGRGLPAGLHWPF
jgi:hypothetical protein